MSLKRLFAMLLVGIMVAMALAACGDNTATTAPTTAAATTAAATTAAATTAAATTAAATTAAATTAAATTAAATTAAATTAAATTAAATTAAGGTGTGAVFHWRQSSEPKTLDPGFITDQTSIEIGQNVFEGLLQLDNKLQVVPAMAQAMPTVSADGLTYTFKLKPGLKFANGDPITSKDFIYSWNRVAQLGAQALYAGIFAEVKGFDEVSSEKDDAKRKTATISGIAAPDDSTITVTLNNPVSYFLTEAALWTYWPVNQKFLESKGDKFDEKNPWSTEAANLSQIATGPYIVKEWKHDVSMRLEANPNYYGTKPSVDVVTVDFVKEDATAKLKYDNGELDEVLVPNADIQKLKKDPKYQGQYKEYASARTTWLQFNFSKTDNPLSTNADLRKAIGYAIDRQLMTDGALNGAAVPTTILIPEGILGYKKPETVNAQVDKAKASLAKAGYDTPDKVKQLSDTINNYGGGKSGGFAFNADSDINKAWAESVQQQLKNNLGLDIKLNPIATFKEFLARRDDQKEFIFMRGSWGADFPDPENFYYELFYSKAGNNSSVYKNPKYDAAVDAGNKAQDTGKRAEAYQQAEQILQDDGAYVPLFNGIVVRLQKPYVQNWGWTAQNIMQFKYMTIKK